MLRKRYTKMLAAAALLAGLTLVGARVHAADPANDPQKLIAVLTSDSPKAEKAITCKKLAVFGGKEAVPALAALLPDAELTSWARIALEAIPGPEADAALRDAMGKVQGRTLIGVINSIAYRRDAKAVDALTAKLKDADVEVATVAAVALGKIGGPQAASALSQALANASTALRSGVAEGCILCAENFMNGGNRDEAVKMYDAVRKADVAKQRVLEGIRGAILARQAAGLPLLVEQLKSSDKAMFHIGLRVARELQVPEVTDALIAEMGTAAPEKQALLVVALADRGDAKALPAVLQAAKAGPVTVRTAAASMLEKIGNASCVPTLVEAAADADADLSLAAKTSLARMGDKEIDAEIFARLQQSSGKMRQVLIELAEQRRIEGAVPVFVKSVEDADPAVRAAALVAIGSIGDDKQTADLAKLLAKVQDATQRSDLEKALNAICSRWGAVCVPNLAPLTGASDGANRISGLRALACCGGNEALAAVKAALDDKDDAVVDETVRTLSTWANRFPDDTAVTDLLLSVAKSGKKPNHQVLAIRGYLQYVQGAKKLGAAQRLAKLNDVQPLITRPEEKRLAVSVLAAIATAGALDQLTLMTADPAIAEEACSAIVNARNFQGATRQQRQKAYQAVVAITKNETTKKKAEDALKAGR